ncbi:MAG TPA: SAM-dependent chlorinase/fluorinase [Vicinamibacteria bacterium]|nr:SAM-dependent chlorinase/fluorinase [Vicinamibacteria bacterium]
MRPIVALLTDFGSRDHYVGALKGAVLAAAPEATVVDVVHDLPPHDVGAGAYALEAAYRAFPAGAAFVAVVDPGVGGDRRELALAAGGYFFVGPDNGIFTLVLAAHPDARVHAITNAGLFRHEVSPTFHARDVFGPVAARLANGLPLEETGPRIPDPVVFDVKRPRRLEDGDWEGEVIHADRFGNLSSSITRADLDAMLATVGGDPTELVVVVEGAVLPLVRTYAEVAEGEACALVGSSRRLEVAVNRGSAARVLGASLGAPVRVRRAESRVL